MVDPKNLLLKDSGWLAERGLGLAGFMPDFRRAIDLPYKS
jgi:hypothetical protein